MHNDAVTPEVASLPTEGALPIRQFFSWPGKRNYEGSWWSSTTRAHVEFESLLERDYLLAADADDQVVAIAAQPLALLWPRNTPYRAEGLAGRYGQPRSVEQLELEQPRTGEVLVQVSECLAAAPCTRPLYGTAN